MEDEMKSATIVRWGPGLTAIAIGGAGLVVGLTAASGNVNSVAIGLSTIVIATVLVVVAHAREWERLAWMPLVGFAVAMVGQVTGHDEVAYGGAMLTMILTIAHGIQEQRRKRHSQVAHG